MRNKIKSEKLNFANGIAGIEYNWDFDHLSQGGIQITMSMKSGHELWLNEPRDHQQQRMKSK